MPRSSIHPDPPVSRFSHGDVWEVIVEPRKKKGVLILGTPEIERYLVLLTAPYRKWPKSEYGFYRSRIEVGSLEDYSHEFIINKVFKAIMRQTPPYVGNWRSNLKMCARGYLVWDRYYTTLYV